MCHDVDLEVLYVSWEGLDNIAQSIVWTGGKQSFFQVTVEQQTLTCTPKAYLPQHLTFASRIFNSPGIQRAGLSLIAVYHS